MFLNGCGSGVEVPLLLLRLHLQFYLMRERSSDHPTSERAIIHPIQQLDGFALQLVECERRPR